MRARCSAPTVGKLHQISPQPTAPSASVSRTSTAGRSRMVPKEVCTGGLAGARVELRIVPAGSFVELLRIGRELVPEAVQVDALATGHQALHVRPAEAEVPEQGVLEDLLPRPDAGDGCIDQHEAPDAVAVLR